VMGNNAKEKVVWKEILELSFTFAKKIDFSECFYIPKIKENLVSTTRLCLKGIKVVLEAKKLILSKMRCLLERTILLTEFPSLVY
jgi:hypothetical protein